MPKPPDDTCRLVDDVYAFLTRIIHGEPVEQSEAVEGTQVPTVEQRIRAALAMLGKLETMSKKATKDGVEALITLTPEDIDALRRQMQRKLDRIVINKPARSVAQQSDAAGTGSAEA